MRKLFQLLQIPPHFHDKVVKFRLEVLFHTVIEQLWESPKHCDRVTARKADFFEVFDSGNELVFDATREQVRVSVNLGDSDALEEI